LEEIELPELDDESEDDEAKPASKTTIKAKANGGSAKADKPGRVADEDYGDEDGTDDNVYVASGSKRKRSDPQSEADDSAKSKPKPASKAKPASKSSKPASTSGSTRASKRSGHGAVSAVTEEAEEMED